MSLEAPGPDLTLLDLDLPRKGGREVLEEVRADPDQRRIPAVIVTASRAEEDILRSYDLHADCYITKPVDGAQLAAMVKAIDDLWLPFVRLPAEAT